MHNLSETRQNQKQDNTTDPWEFNEPLRFAANLNLKGHQFFLTHPVEDNRKNCSVANDSLVSKSTQPVSEINTGAEKNNTIKHELVKQLNDYRSKQRDSYSQMNRQHGQGAAVNHQRGQNAAGVNRQRGHNNGANRQHGLNARMSQNNHKHNNSRVRDRNTQTKRFFFRRTEKNHQLGDENRPFLTSSRNQKTPTINLTKQMSSWREYLVEFLVAHHYRP